MSRSQGYAQSTAYIMNNFVTAVLPIVNETYAIGGALGSKAIIETLPWAVIVNSSLSIIIGILNLIGSPPTRKKSTFINLTLEGVMLGAGVKATTSTFSETGNLADFSGLFSWMTLLSFAQLIYFLSNGFTHNVNDYPEEEEQDIDENEIATAKKTAFQLAVGSFVSLIGCAALSYGYQWGWVLCGGGTLLNAITNDIPATYNNFFAKPQPVLDEHDVVNTSPPDFVIN